MFLEEKANKCKKIKKVCCIYAGKGHLISTIGRFIIEKVDKGAKTLLFTDNDLRTSLTEKAGLFIDDYDTDKISNNIIQFPCKSMKEVLDNKFFGNYLSKLVKLTAVRCSEEGIIICIQDSSSDINGFMDEMEHMLEDVSVDVFFVNCYEFIQDKKFIINSLNTHDYIINTNGIREIGSTFEEVQPKSLSPH